MIYARVALALVQLGNILFNWARERGLLQAGEDRGALKSLQAMQAVSNALRDVDERHNKMTDDAIRQELELNQDFRD